MGALGNARNDSPERILRESPAGVFRIEKQVKQFTCRLFATGFF
jgi:hypothetical protein